MSRKKIVWMLLIINTLLIFLHIFPIPFIYDTFCVLASHKEGTIGIIGGADGPTAIFISSNLSWHFIVTVILEVFLVIYLFFSRFRKADIDK